MTTTERLRALLDKRGVEWKAFPDKQESEFTITATQWHDSEGSLLTMYIDDETGNTWDFFWLPTIEQAVDATLGKETHEDDDYVSVQKIIDHADEMVTKYKIKIALKDYFEDWRGTCAKIREWEDDPRGGGGWVLVCSECDELLANDGEDGEFDGPNFCPNCGRRIVRGEV